MKLTTKVYKGGSSKQENLIKSIFLNPILTLFPIAIAIVMYVKGYGLPFHFITGILQSSHIFLSSLLLDLAALAPLIIGTMFVFMLKCKSFDSSRSKVIGTILIILYFASFIGCFNKLFTIF